ACTFDLREEREGDHNSLLPVRVLSRDILIDASEGIQIPVVINSSRVMAKEIKKRLILVGSPRFSRMAEADIKPLPYAIASSPNKNQYWLTIRKIPKSTTLIGLYLLDLKTNYWDLLFVFRPLDRPRLLAHNLGATKPF